MHDQQKYVLINGEQVWKGGRYDGSRLNREVHVGQGSASRRKNQASSPLYGNKKAR